jgi:ATP-binding cassette subfamily B protein
VALARLFLANPPVMILDDTTSAVDIETEKKIQESLNTLKGNHTLFIVAHRLISVEQADLILVLEHGRIVQRGTHADLIATPGYYREVWDHQTGRGE